MGKTEILAFIVLISVTIFVFFAVIIGMIVQYRRKKISYEHEKKVTDELHKSELLNIKMEVQEETMQQIGIEIHDFIAQKLTLASLRLQQIEYENRYAELNSSLITTSSLINESLDDLRQLSHKLLRNSKEQIDIVDLLKSEYERVKQLGICNIHFKSDCSGLSVTTDAGHTILRIVQEFIQNSLKHSGCKNLQLSIDSSDSFRLFVSDDGKGFDMNAEMTGGGFGLKNIRKRAGLIHADLVISSQPGSGTSMQLSFPQIS